jgi:hypothetical protein
MDTPTTMLEAVWEQREEVLYRDIFGDRGSGIYTLSPDIFANTFKQSCDPRWLTIGVFECASTANRPTWTYVSSGLSNPWEDEAPPDDPDAASGLGVEYVFNTTAQAQWAIQLVQHIAAYEVLLAHGRFPGRDAILIGDRIPVQIRDKTDRLSAIRRVLVVEPEFIPMRHRLASGELCFLQLVGITEAEAELARKDGYTALCDKLRQAKALHITDPWRDSVV